MVKRVEGKWRERERDDDDDDEKTVYKNDDGGIMTQPLFFNDQTSRSHN